MSWYFIKCYVIVWHGMRGYVKFCYVILCYVRLWRVGMYGNVLLCNVNVFNVMLCYRLAWYVRVCDVLQCYAMLC